MELLLPKGKYEVTEILKDISYSWGKNSGKSVDYTIKLRRIF